MTTTQLSQANLNELPVQGPEFDRSRVTAGVVHFGVGGFHRAHQALYIDKLMRQGEAMDFGIIGMGVMPSDIRMRDALKSQDFLYTLTEKTPDGQQSSRVIGSIIDYLYTPEDPANAVAVLADASIKIVSLTVTEGGYNFDHVRGEFNFDNPQVAADIADLKQVVVQAKEEPADQVFDMVEQMPTFPGGDAELMKYISKNLRYPAIAQENGIQGRVICQFVVGKDGQVRDVVVVRKLDPSCDKEAVRVLSGMPKWIPGKQNGKAVSVKYTVPIVFRLQ